MSGARLKKTLSWSAGLVYQDEFYVNHYEAAVSLVTVSRDSDQQNIAYERIKFWTQRVMDGAIFLAHDDARLSVWQDTGARIIVLPDEPVDQIIGIMLYLKLNLIMENRMVITDIEISSLVGDHTSYLHSHGEGLGEGLEKSGWWTDPRPVWSDVVVKKTSGKIVSLSKSMEWSEHGLAWDMPAPSNDTVVFARFPKNEDQ